jgi:hypothetical protein
MRHVIIAVVFACILFSACDSTPKSNDSSVSSTQVVTPASADRISFINEPIVKIIFPNLLVPTYTSAELSTNSEYCNYDDAMKVIKVVDELTKNEVSTTPTPMPSSKIEIPKITKEQSVAMISETNRRIDEIDQLKVPECLRSPVDHFRATFINLRDFYTITNNRTESENIGLLMLIGQEGNMFDKEYSRVKECIPTGCK